VIPSDHRQQLSKGHHDECGPALTIMYPDPLEIVVTDPGVYAPQHDSRLLIEALQKTNLAPGRHVLDLCTGSGVVAVTAAQLGALNVTAFDICPRAVRCSRANAESVGVQVNVRMGSLTDALARGPFDVVVSNPPYVPTGPEAHSEKIPLGAGPAGAWNAGDDGRLVLRPLCAAAPDLLNRGGTMLIVQSEFSGVEQSLVELRARGLDAEILMWQSVPFGPVLTARAQWLESIGWLQEGRREEELVVIRADKTT
jgi:release factor glutamine methyltransferase